MNTWPVCMTDGMIMPIENMLIQPPPVSRRSTKNLYCNIFNIITKSTKIYNIILKYNLDLILFCVYLVDL